MKSLSAVALLICSTALAQESVAVFDATVVAVDRWARMESLIDVDLDGDLDALGGWLNSVRRTDVDVEVYLNDGAGDFGSATWTLGQYVVGYDNVNALYVAVGDWTGDGAADIAALVPGELLTWRVQAGAMPVAMPSITTTFDARGTCALDVDGNGFDDLAVRTTNGVELFLGAQTQLVFAGSWNGLAQDLLAVDVDGDGVDELAVLQGTDLVCLEWNGGSLSPVRTLAHGVGGVPHPTCGDVDGDGDQDVVVFGGSGYVLLRRDGASTFVAESVVVGGPATGLADVDGDGDLDGVCCGGSGSQPSPSNAARANFEVSINDGSGRFAPAVQIPNLGARHIAGAADIDADGDVDLVAGRGVYFNRGGRSFERGDLQPMLPNATGRNPRTDDIDGDGDVDFDVVRSQVARNRGDGLAVVSPNLMPFAPPGMYAAGAGYRGDFDGDGAIDFVTSRFLANGTFESMRFMRNQGGGTFEDAGPATVPGEPFNRMPAPFQPSHGEEWHLTADLDDDGDLDIVTTHHVAHVGNPYGGSQIWWNDGSGYFTPGQLIANWLVQHAMDFDGDGVLDLFATGTYSGFGMLKGAPDHTWSWNSGAAPDFRDTISIQVRWALSDIDADGDIDVIGDNSDDPTIWVNDGAGHFTETFPLGRFDYMAWAGNSIAHVMDFDADGALDFLSFPAAASSSSATMLSRQNPDGSFSRFAEQVFVAYDLVDADGDGDLDAIGDRLVRGARFDREHGGRREQFGSAVRGTGLAAPTIGETGPYRAGEISTSVITGGLGGSPAVYVWGTDRADLVDLPFPGLTLYPWPPIAAVPVTLTGAIGAPGAGGLEVRYTIPSVFGGLTLYKQALILDPAGPFSLTQTNGIAVTYGL